MSVWQNLWDYWCRVAIIYCVVFTTLDRGWKLYRAIAWRIEDKRRRDHWARQEAAFKEVETFIQRAKREKRNGKRS